MSRAFVVTISGEIKKMLLNRFIKISIIISVSYIGAAFFWEDQIMSSLKNPALLIWISVFLSAVNIGLSLTYLFFWGGTVTVGIVLLTLSQLAVFFQLHIQIHNLRGAENYAYAFAPFWYDWIKFIAGHTLRAIDLLDAVGAYSLSPNSIRHQSLFSAFALLGMYLMAGWLMLAVIFNLINMRSCDIFSGESARRRNREIIRWIRRGAAFLSVGMILVFGWKQGWSLKNWLLCFSGNILFTLDFGDAIQIFDWQSALVTAHLPENGGPPAALSLFFRLMTGVYAIVLLNRFYLRMAKAHDRKAVEELMMIWTSHEYSTRERILAIKKLEAFTHVSDVAMPYLVKSLSETNKSVRAEAAEALKKIDTEWMKSEIVKKEISHLSNLLEKEDKSVRTAAVEALGEMGPVAVKAVPDLIKLLKKNEMTASAAHTLEKIGQAAIPELIKVLTHDNDEVRESVVQVLEKIDPRWFQNDNARREIGFFIRHLSDTGSTRVSAVSVLGEFGAAAEAAVPMLVSLLADRDARKSAVKSLGKIGHGATAGIAPLIDLLADSDEEIRSLAVQALEKIAPNWQQSESALNAVPAFMQALGNRNASAYEAPEEALCLTGSAAIHLLTEALAERNKDIVNIAAKTLKKIDPEWFRNKNAALAVPRLAAALSDSEWYVRAAAAQVLGKIGPGAIKAVPHLVKSLADTNKNVRDLVKKALEMVTVKHTESQENSEADTEKESSEQNSSRWSEDELMNAEITRLGDSKKEVRDAAAAALEKMNPQWRKSEAVRNALPDFVNSLGEGVGTAFDSPREALLTIGVPAIFHLVKSLAEKNKTVSAAAVQLLEQTDPQWHQTPGAREAIPYLEKALSDSEWYVRDAAAKVLGKIGPAAIKAVPFLVKAMADTNKTVRSTAKEALDKIVLK